ncbi:MAG: hypothetical protein NTW19_01515 [Planctomycetota bacterium]|nr:hypothetical protein [Planctomycetota bacterium]
MDPERQKRLKEMGEKLKKAVDKAAAIKAKMEALTPHRGPLGAPDASGAAGGSQPPPAGLTLAEPRHGRRRAPYNLGPVPQALPELCELLVEFKHRHQGKRMAGTSGEIGGRGKERGLRQGADMATSENEFSGTGGALRWTCCG